MNKFMDIPRFFYEDELYEDLEFVYEDDLIGEKFTTSAKIVELNDIGCDAFSAGISSKNRSIGMVKKKKDKILKNLDAMRRVKEKYGAKGRKKGLDRNTYFDHVLANEENSMGNSHLAGLVGSNVRFYVAESTDNFFKNSQNTEKNKQFGKTLDGQKFEDESYEILDGKKFINRGVDSDCLSTRPSESSLTDDTSGSIFIEKKIEKFDEILRVKKLASKNGNEKISIEKSGKKENGGSMEAVILKKSNILLKEKFVNDRKKLGFASRTIINPKNVNKNNKNSEIPRFIGKSFDNKNSNIRIGKNINLEGSKLPVWRGNFTNNSTVIGNDKKNEKFMKIDEKNDEIITRIRIFDEIEIDQDESQLIRNENIYDIIDERSCEKEAKMKKRLEILINNNLDRINFEEIENSEKIKSAKENKENEKNNNLKDQSKSDLWSENYEAAYIKGREVGLKIYRMAKAARDNRKKEFQKYGFENYNQKPRKNPQEILDIGIELVEKIIDDRNEIYCEIDD